MTCSLRISHTLAHSGLVKYAESGTGLVLFAAARSPSARAQKAGPVRCTMRTWREAGRSAEPAGLARVTVVNLAHRGLCARSPAKPDRQQDGVPRERTGVRAGQLAAILQPAAARRVTAATVGRRAAGQLVTGCHGTSGPARRQVQEAAHPAEGQVRGPGRSAGETRASPAPLPRAGAPFTRRDYLQR